MLFKLVILLVSLDAFSFDQAMIDKIQTTIDFQTNQNGSIGISVGLVEGNQRVILQSGKADLIQNIALEKDDFFAIGSVTKTFTSLLLSKAVSSGLVSIDDKVQSILAEFSHLRLGSFTLRQLSTHTSGLQRDVVKTTQGPYLPFENYSREMLVEELNSASITPIKDNIQYSNLGVALLGLCLEKIYKDTFDNIIYREILNPLNLSEIKNTIDYTTDINLVKKYTSAFLNVEPWKDLGVFNPVGSFKASTSLMLDYLYAQLNPEQTSLSDIIKNSQKELHKFSKYSIGYGWFINKRSYGHLYSHSGSTLGFSTKSYFVPESKKGLIVFTNSGSHVECVGSIFLASKDCTAKTVLSDTSDVTKEISGIYSTEDPKVAFKITSTGYGFVTLLLIGQDYPTRLFKVNANNYEFMSGTGTVEFVKNSRGKVDTMKFSQLSDGKTYSYTGQKTNLALKELLE
jgi:CubicO group peptidase (beta-lactamase class C family)